MTIDREVTLAGLRLVAGWNEFAASLVSQHERKGKLSAAQWGAAERMLDKLEQRRRERDRRERSAPVVDASRVRAMFDAALESGLNRRALLAAQYNADGSVAAKVKLTPARPPRDEVWIKVDGEFCGGIGGDGKLRLRDHAPAWLAAVVDHIAADPDAACRLYGQRTGVCACCGRTLTNAESIALGIGPVCRAKWGLA